MRTQDALQQLRVHVLVEDIHVAQSMPAEACPCIDLSRMRILVDAVLWIQRLALRPSNEHLTPEAFTPEDLLICELDTHPVFFRPTLVALSE